MAPHVQGDRIPLALRQVRERMSEVFLDDLSPYPETLPGELGHESGESLTKAQRQGLDDAD
jgi:hypothetical protein